MELHLGQKIFEILQEKGISKSEFARQLQTSRQNVQDILKRESLDTLLLHNISQLLDYNFFELLSSNLSGNDSMKNEKHLVGTQKELLIKIEALSKELSLIKSQME